MYPQSVFCAKIRKNIIFSAENFKFLLLQKSLYITWTCFRNSLQEALAGNTNKKCLHSDGSASKILGARYPVCHVSKNKFLISIKL